MQLLSMQLERKERQQGQLVVEQSQGITFQ